MNEQELLELMNTAFADMQVLSPQRPPCVKRKLSVMLNGVEDEKPRFSLNQIQELFDTIENSSSEEDFMTSAGVRYLMVRFLIQTNEQILLARAGAPDSKIPVHQEMSNRCLSAGYLFFNQNQLVGIDHFSRDFDATAKTLVFALRALLNAPELVLAPNLFLWLNHYGTQEQCLPVSENMIAQVQALEHAEVEDEFDLGYATP